MISESIKYVGVEDKSLDIFESQYSLKNGVTYNSYIILDDEIAIMDTVDLRAQAQWTQNVETTLNGKNPNYLIVSHMEPDHGANIFLLAQKYPDMKIVGNVKTFVMMEQFFGTDFKERQVVVKEGDVLELGHHSLQFVMAPMVHWPEVMMSYEKTEKVFFSADAFGRFGLLDDQEWISEARRYYYNIVGKYGLQVQSLLKKVSVFDIQTICPLHGPVLVSPLDEYIKNYQLWSSYQAQEAGVMVAYASIHGHTTLAVDYLVEKLRMLGENVVVHDLTREDLSYAVSDAFAYDRIVLAACSYDGGVFPPMEDFLNHLKSKNYQKRCVSLIENGSWAPSALKTMKTTLETMKGIEFIEPFITIRSAMNEQNKTEMNQLAEEIMKGGCQSEICM
ncbi:MAG: FprA family A-type flavoprotein [Coprobacillus sp.]